MTEILFLLIYIVPLFALILVGPVLTVLNILRLSGRFPRLKTIDLVGFGLGIPLTLFLYRLWDAPDWQDPLIFDTADINIAFHAPLASQHLPTVLTLAALALAGYLLLRLRGKTLPPLPLALSITASEVGTILSAVFLVQLGKYLFETAWLACDVFLMTLVPLNYILCAAHLLYHTAKEQAARRRALSEPPASPLLAWCDRLLSRCLSWYILGFVLALPLLGIVLLILVLLGQAPDAAVRAFTDTADWTFSQQIPPPPVYYDGHYLCTVAAGGHRKVVKPLRTGNRLGHTILVNRQLCIANAFEELLADRTPRLHRALRGFYDRRGYPLSQKITTPLRADVTYLLMKPLEWLFLLTLYTFDRDPESRIARQYPPRPGNTANGPLSGALECSI